MAAVLGYDLLAATASPPVFHFKGKRAPMPLHGWMAFGPHSAPEGSALQPSSLIRALGRAPCYRRLALGSREDWAGPEGHLLVGRAWAPQGPPWGWLQCLASSWGGVTPTVFLTASLPGLPVYRCPPRGCSSQSAQLQDSSTSICSLQGSSSYGNSTAKTFFNI